MLLYMRFFHLLPVLLSLTAHAQGDWDTYLMEVNNKPLSVVVDLGLAQKAPQKERPFVIIIRTKINKPQTNGLPGETEASVMDNLEDSLVYYMEQKSGAVYAGRFTQRGLREFYFYTLDTVDYLLPAAKAFKNFTSYQWLCQAKEDKKWSNYFEVLYPPDKEMERIQNRRTVDNLKRNGDALKTPRQINHTIYFKTKSSRELFLKEIKESGFKFPHQPDDDPGAGEYPYKLQLFRDDIPSYTQIDRVCLYLWELARKFNGRYDGWETFVVK
jgi:hypothetical protein